MPITVDTKNETVSLQFVDAEGNQVAAPSGAVVEFTVVNSTDLQGNPVDSAQVATVAVDSSNPLQGDITPVGVGKTQFGATTNGTALDPSGNPIPDPSPSAVLEIDPGAAVGERLVLAPNQ